MRFSQILKMFGDAASRYTARQLLAEKVGSGRASAVIAHRRPTDFVKDKATGLLVPDRFRLLDEPELVWNQITNAGRDYLHVQGYGTSGLGANGLNWIALTNTAVTPAAGDTTLSGEIVSNGLSRAQGTVTHTNGTNTTGVDKTFTATGTQACQACALFSASSVGTMNHELTFTQRSLVTNDTIQITYTITLG
jgi:hypothetical protein